LRDSNRQRHRLPLPGDDEAHVWTALLSETTPRLTVLAGLLSPEEKQRAARFLRPDDQARYIVTHGILRQLLSRYLSVAPAMLGFSMSAFGKPALTQRTGERPLSFNLAHSGDVILYVVASGRRVGVDVEAIRTDLDIMELAQRQFSLQETNALKVILPPERTEAFFRCWTRKEAYVKARGEGLSFPLDKFTVTMKRDEMPELRWVENDPSGLQPWSMFHLEPLSGYAGAVVVEGRNVNLLSYPWPSSS
jgi:4'-phosphopantetheinyl transferase